MVREESTSDYAWLTTRPIAHRGLHDRAAGRMENTLSAARAAVAANFSIECDVQLSADGDAMVFHDFTLDRLTSETGMVSTLSARSLSMVEVGRTGDRIPNLNQLLEVIAARVPLICEIKSAFDGDMRLAERITAIARSYAGPLAIKSFDPAVIAHLRRQTQSGPKRPLGIVAEAQYRDPEWKALTPDLKRELAALSHFAETRPDFLSYAVNDLPHAAVSLFRLGLGAPVVTWTVRTDEQRDQAAKWADQVVFEGFAP